MSYLMLCRLLYCSGWCTWWLMMGGGWWGGGGILSSCRGCDWALSGGGGVGMGGAASFLTGRGGGVAIRGLGGGVAAGTARAGSPGGGVAGAGAGLGTAGANGVSTLCSWLRWRPETLVELQVLDSRISFAVTPADENATQTNTHKSNRFLCHFNQTHSVNFSPILQE